MKKIEEEFTVKCMEQFGVSRWVAERITFNTAKDDEDSLGLEMAVDADGNCEDLNSLFVFNKTREGHDFWYSKISSPANYSKQQMFAFACIEHLGVSAEVAEAVVKNTINGNTEKSMEVWTDRVKTGTDLSGLFFWFRSPEGRQYWMDIAGIYS